MGRQRQQAGLLFGPDVGDTAVGVVGMTSAVGDIVSPAAELGVDVVEVAEGPRGEERVRRYWICLSIFPFSFPRPGVQGRGAKW